MGLDSEIAKAIIKLEADLGGLQSALATANGQMQSWQNENDKRGVGVLQTFKNVASGFQAAWAPITAGIAGVGGMLTWLYGILEEQERIVRKMKVAYGDSFQDALAFADALAEGTAFDNDVIREAMADTHKLLEGLGLSLGDESALMASAMNIAANKGVELSEVLGGLTKAVDGSGKAAKAYGIVIDDDRLKQTMYGGALADNWKYLTENEKAQIRLESILTQSAIYDGSAQGATTDLGTAFNLMKDDVEASLVPSLLFLKTVLVEVIDDLRRSYDAVTDFLSVRKALEGLTKMKIALFGGMDGAQKLKEYEASLKAMDKAEEELNAKRKARMDAERGHVDANELAKQLLERKTAEERTKNHDKEMREKDRKLEKEREENLQRDIALAKVYDLSDAELTLVNNWLNRADAIETGHKKVIDAIQLEYEKDIAAADVMTLTTRQRKDAWNSQYNQMLVDTNAFWGGVELALNNYVVNMKSYGEQGAKFFSDATTTINGTFQDVFVDGLSSKLDSASSYFEAFTDGIKRNIASALATFATNTLMSGAADVLLGGAGGGVGGGGGLGSGLGTGLGVAAGTSGLLGGAAASIYGGASNALWAASPELFAMAPVLGPLGLLAAGGLAAGGLIYGIGESTNWGKGEQTKGSKELGTWQNILQDAGLSTASGAEWGAISTDIPGLSADNLIGPYQDFAGILTEVVNLTGEFREELGFTNASAQEMASVLINAFATSGQGLSGAIDFMRQIRLKEMVAGFAGGETSYADYQDYQRLLGEQGYAQMQEAQLSAIYEKLAGGGLTEEEFKRLQEQASLIQDNLRTIGDRFGVQPEEFADTFMNGSETIKAAVIAGCEEGAAIISEAIVDSGKSVGVYADDDASRWDVRA